MPAKQNPLKNVFYYAAFSVCSENIPKLTFITSRIHAAETFKNYVEAEVLYRAVTAVVIKLGIYKS